jgi:hypothetical protein
MKTIRIYRNPGCQPDGQHPTLTQRLDWFDRVESSTDQPPSGPVLPGTVVVQDLRTGAWFHGVEAARKVCAAVPFYWPGSLLLSLPPVARWFESYRAEVGATS